MFWFSLLFLGTTLTKPYKKFQTRFLDKFSLVPPHVGANGKEEFFEFLNEYVNKTRSRRDHTQLGYRATNSYGAIVSKNPFSLKEYEVSFDFSIGGLERGGGNGAGFGFWISDTITNVPEFYGRNHHFNGFGVAIDIESGTPVTKFIDTRNLKKGGVSLSNSPNTFYRVIFHKAAGTLTVKIIQNGKENILYTGPMHTSRDSRLSITSYSGTSRGYLILERVITNILPPTIKKETGKGGRSIYIIILGGGAIIYLVYYLYQKRPKEFTLKA